VPDSWYPPSVPPSKRPEVPSCQSCLNRHELAFGALDLMKMAANLFGVNSKGGIWPLDPSN
jgi:hypothetical protein